MHSNMHSVTDVAVQNQKLRTIFPFKSTFYARSCDWFYGQIDNNNLLDSDYYQSDSKLRTC